jgi:hypothetical protein
LRYSSTCDCHSETHQPIKAVLLFGFAPGKVLLGL